MPSTPEKGCYHYEIRVQGLLRASSARLLQMAWFWLLFTLNASTARVHAVPTAPTCTHCGWRAACCAHSGTCPPSYAVFMQRLQVTQHLISHSPTTYHRLHTAICSQAMVHITCTQPGLELFLSDMQSETHHTCSRAQQEPTISSSSAASSTSSASLSSAHTTGTAHSHATCSQCTCS